MYKIKHLEGRVVDLELGLDNFEQYGRRVYLRFHGVPMKNTDNTKHMLIC